MKNDFFVIGMSPGNSYFKQEVIDQILTKALGEYKNIGIFIPDVPAISTYIALGYPENIARREKAMRQGNVFRNRIKNSIQTQGLDANRIRVFDWKEEKIETHPDYIIQYNYVNNLYSNNRNFSDDVKEITSKVLQENPFKKKELSDQDIEIATHYFLSELAFMLFLPNYVGFEKCIYVYHKSWPVFERFINGDYDQKKKDNMGFLLFPEFK